MSDQASASQLLAITRESLERFVRRGRQPEIDLAQLPPSLNQPSSSFVTLRKHGVLRGCIGSTDARWPLAYDAARNAVAASQDPRFAPVAPLELPDIRIEISILSPPRPLPYASHADLLQKLRPYRDGVIVSWEQRRALLLPQVWSRVAEPERFLDILCHKAKITLETLRAQPPLVSVFTFVVDCYAEDGYYSE